jgi:hypothetical protein
MRIARSLALSALSMVSFVGLTSQIAWAMPSPKQVFKHEITGQMSEPLFGQGNSIYINNHTSNKFSAYSSSFTHLWDINGCESVYNNHDVYYVLTFDGTVYKVTGASKQKLFWSSMLVSNDTSSPHFKIIGVNANHIYIAPDTGHNLLLSFTLTGQVSQITTFTPLSTNTNFDAPTGHIISEAAISSNGNVYALTDNSLLIDFDSTGKERWSVQLGHLTSSIGASLINLSTPVVAADGTVFAMNPAGQLFAVNPNGTIKWNSPGYSLDSYDRIPHAETPHLLKGGVVVVSDLTDDTHANVGYLHAFSQATGAALWSKSFPGEIYDTVSPTGSSIYVSAIEEDSQIVEGIYDISSNGKVLWKYTFKSLVPYGGYVPFKFDGKGNLYAIVQDMYEDYANKHQDKVAFLYIFNATTGALKECLNNIYPVVDFSARQDGKFLVVTNIPRLEVGGWVSTNNDFVTEYTV